MNTRETYHIWPRDLRWGDKIAAVEVSIRKRGYSVESEPLSLFHVEESTFRSRNADSLHEFIELLRRFPHFEALQTLMCFKKKAPAGSGPEKDLVIEIIQRGPEVKVSVKSANTDVVEGILRSIADELCLSNPSLPLGKHIELSSFNRLSL